MIKWCIKNKIIIAIICLFISIVGVRTYINMERQENPDVVSPMAKITTIYPGATPKDIERLINKPIEDEVNEIANVDTIESFSIDNAGIMTVQLKDLPDDVIAETWKELKDKVEKAELPAGASEPDVDTSLTETYGMLFTISGDDYSYKDLKAVADDVQYRLEKVEGVAKVEIEGYQEDQIHINLDSQRMKNYNISMTQIGTVLKARNINIPGGSLKLEDANVPVTITGEYTNMQEIENTIVSMSADGNVVYLKDIADIQLTDGERTIYTRSNGEKSLLLALKYEEKENVVQIGKGVHEEIAAIKSELADDMTLRIITDQSDYVEKSVGDFRDNLISAIVLVVIVVFITMGARSALVVSSSIPITILITFVAMGIFGTVLHQVSIASLIVCLGLLVANAIVANDNMYLYLSKPVDSRDDAVIQAIQDVKIPILTSTLTTIASFAPLLMMKGVAGKFIRDLPIMVTITLIASYLVSLTVVPAMGHKFLESIQDRELKIYKKRQKKLKGKKHNITVFQRIGQVANRRFRNVMDLSMKLPGLTILVSVGILVVSSLVIPTMKVQLFPFVDRDQYVIKFILKEGTNVDKTNEAVKAVEKILLEDEGVDNFLVKVGDGLPKFYTTFFGNQQGSNQAEFVVNGRVADIPEMQRKLDSEIPGSRIEISQLENAEPVALPIQVRISGEDTEVLQALAEDVKAVMENIPNGQYVQDNYGAKTLGMKVNVDQEKASMVGLSNYDISGTVRMAIEGAELTKLKPSSGSDDIPVILRVPAEEKHKVNILDDIFVTSQVTKKNVPLSQVATIETDFSLNKIIRRDRERTITIGMHPKPGSTSAEIMTVIEEEMKDFELPEGYTLVYGGESENRSETIQSMKGPLIAAIVLIYLILMFQFSDLIQPLLIMLTIPLSFIGVIWGLKFTGSPIGFMALIGAISLMGIVVNNGIVLLDYINILVRRGTAPKEAAKHAAIARVRPIMIGMVTTVIGLLPLGLTGGTLWAPMAYTVVFGLLVSSVLTMLVIPAGYVLLSNVRQDRNVVISQKRKARKAEKLKELEAMKAEMGDIEELKQLDSELDDDCSFENEDKETAEENTEVEDEIKNENLEDGEEDKED